MKKTSYLIILLLSVAILGACSGGDDKGSSACVADGEQLFDCVERDDFKNYQGHRTSLSQRIAECTIIEYISEICSISTLNFIANDNAIVNCPQPSAHDDADAAGMIHPADRLG